MNLISTKLLVLLAASATFACAADHDPATNAAPDDADLVGVSQSAILAKVDVGYGDISFYKTTSEDGEVTLGVTETASAYATGTPFAATMSRKGHTLLELFKAVAPDQEPPADLVASHPVEAEKLKRPNSSVVTPDFDKNAPVQKALQACVDFIWQVPVDPRCYPWVNKRELTTTADAWLPVGTSNGDFTHMTGEMVTMGVCNPTGTATNITTAYNQDLNNPSYNIRMNNLVVPAYTQTRDWNITNATSGPDCTGYPICFANLHPARYAVHKTAGANATLMTAEINYNLGCLQ